ncbi:hypothetical protein CR513_52258, partial [Mucuna pruriens]
MANYKVERLGLPESSLEECLGALIGFTGEQVEIRGKVDLETMFGMGSNAKTITIKFTGVGVVMHGSWPKKDDYLTPNKDKGRRRGPIKDKLHSILTPDRDGVDKHIWEKRYA